MTRWPPATSVSLFAVATTLPARSAARTGPRLTTPPVPTDHEIHVVPRRQALQRIVTRDALGPGGQVERAESVGGGQRDRGWPDSRRLLGEELAVAAGREGDDPEGVRVGRQDLDRLAPDRPGRAEQRHPARTSSQTMKATTYSITTGAANRNESTRSSIPP